VGQDAVTATGYALLGLLSFGRELSGYELRRWAGNSLRHFYVAPAMSQVYAELERLEAAGLTASREVPQGSRRVRVHRITPEGEAAAAAWLRTPPDPPQLKHHLLLRVFLGHLLEPDELRRAVQEHVRWCEDELRSLDAVLEELGDDPAWANARLVAQWGVEHHRADRAAARRLLRALEAGEGRVPGRRRRPVPDATGARRTRHGDHRQREPGHRPRA
jgi:DNA-binding PadR family transcriptional regulator